VTARVENSSRHAAKMNAAAEVLRLRHWPPRGVYTRWRPRKRFCSGIVCIPPTSARNLSALRDGVCSKLDICGLFFVIFHTSISTCRGCKAIRTSEFQNGTLAQRCDRVHRMATSASKWPSLRLARDSTMVADRTYRSRWKYTPPLGPASAWWLPRERDNHHIAPSYRMPARPAHRAI